MVRLKESAILCMYDVWNSTGKPMSGQVHDIKCSSHLRYKLAIRDCYVKFETQLYDELYDRFLKIKGRQNSGNPGIPSLGKISVTIFLLMTVRTVVALQTSLLITSVLFIVIQLVTNHQ